MSIAVTSMRWIDILESEFDKAYVELYNILPELDCEETELIDMAKSRMASMSASFAQLVHKTLSISQNNAKLEAQVVDFRERVANSCVQQDIKTSKAISDLYTLQQRCSELEKENHMLNQLVLSLQGEVYGAKLASKYLDKELAGRIQQLQLLCKPNMNAELQTKLWNQIESEIFLHRHKTVARACRGRTSAHCKLQTEKRVTEEYDFRPQAIKSSSKVHLKINESEGLGISITGGSEHGLPIVISKVHQNSAAANSKKIFPGDSIVSVNSTLLQGVTFNEALKHLSNLHGDVELELLSDLSDAEDINLKTIQYPIITEEVGSNMPDIAALQSRYNQEGQLECSNAQLLGTSQITEQPTPLDNPHESSHVNNPPEGLNNSEDGAERPCASSVPDASNSGQRHPVQVGQYTMSAVQSGYETENAVFNSFS